MKYRLILFSLVLLLIGVGCKKPQPTPDPKPVEALIVFDYDYDNIIERKTTTVGSQEILPTPEREGYRFLGWFNHHVELINSPLAITGNMSLIAHWEQLTYEINFNYDNRSFYTVTVSAGETPVVDWEAIRNACIISNYTAFHLAEPLVPAYEAKTYQLIGEEMTPGITFEKVNDEVTVTGIVNDAPFDLLIPNYYDGLAVTKIAPEAFRRNDNLLTVTFPQTLKEIGAYAFCECFSLTKVDLAAEVVGESAFEGSHVKTVTIASTVKSLGQNAFYSSRVETITLTKATQLGNHFISWNQRPITINIPQADLEAVKAIIEAMRADLTLIYVTEIIYNPI